ncbi:MAG TPA: DinB family protein [Thermoanaerobaculia bacterium]
MKRTVIVSCSALAALLLAAAPLVHAADAKAAPAKAAAAVKASGAATERADVLRSLGDAKEKLISLAEATPAEKFAWRPAEGVRSVGEVYLHVAQANFGLPTLWGGKPAEGVDVKNLEKEGGDKAKTVDLLKRSFDHAQSAIDAVPEADLGKEVNLFGRQTTVNGVVVLLASHAHEHLGQSIAYARMNGIVPPWSAAQGKKTD